MPCMSNACMLVYSMWIPTSTDILLDSSWYCYDWVLLEFEAWFKMRQGGLGEHYKRQSACKIPRNKECHAQRLTPFLLGSPMHCYHVWVVQNSTSSASCMHPNTSIQNIQQQSNTEQHTHYVGVVTQIVQWPCILPYKNCWLDNSLRD